MWQRATWLAVIKAPPTSCLYRISVSMVIGKKQNPNKHDVLHPVRGKNRKKKTLEATEEKNFFKKDFLKYVHGGRIVGRKADTLRYLAAVNLLRC